MQATCIRQHWAKQHRHADAAGMLISHYHGLPYRPHRSDLKVPKCNRRRLNRQFGAGQQLYSAPLPSWGIAAPASLCVNARRIVGRAGVFEFLSRCKILQVDETVYVPRDTDHYYSGAAVFEQRTPELERTMIVQQMFAPMNLDQLGNNNRNQPIGKFFL